MSPGGISSIVLGYSRLDGGTTRVGAGKVSLCSDLIVDGPTLARGDISIKRVHCVSYVCAEKACLSVR